jgi:hypothetical protein
LVVDLGFGMGIAESWQGCRVVAAQAVGVACDGQPGTRHRGGDDRRQPDPEEWIHDPGGDNPEMSVTSAASITTSVPVMMAIPTSAAGARASAVVAHHANLAAHVRHFWYRSSFPARPSDSHPWDHGV